MPSYPGQDNQACPGRAGKSRNIPDRIIKFVRDEPGKAAISRTGQSSLSGMSLEMSLYPGQDNQMSPGYRGKNYKIPGNYSNFVFRCLI